jgi:hypothetical protein
MKIYLLCVRAIIFKIYWRRKGQRDWEGRKGKEKVGLERNKGIKAHVDFCKGMNILSGNYRKTFSFAST